MTHFYISTSGDNALWLDYLKLYGQWTGKIAHFGRTGGKGWCLSTDPKDGKSWVKSKKVDKRCYRKFKFNIVKKKVYGYN